MLDQQGVSGGTGRGLGYQSGSRGNMRSGIKLNCGLYLG